jgi:hypothetical protein
MCKIQDYIYVVLAFKIFLCFISPHDLLLGICSSRFGIFSRYLVEHKEVNVNVRDKWDSTPL